MEAKSVVVILDADKEPNSRVFHWALNGLSLKPGDKITLVAVLHQFYTPMGYKNVLDSTSIVGVNEKIIEMQASRRKEVFQNNEELIQISELYESKKVEFGIELVIGTLPEVALSRAQELNATWIILDRQMKKEGEHFLQNLSCGISRLKRDNKIEHLRGPPILPTEIHCISPAETYDDSVRPEDEDTFSGEGDSKKIDQLSREQGKTQSNPHKEDHSTLTIISHQPSQKSPDQVRTGEEECSNIHDDRWAFRHATNDDQFIDPTKAEPLSQDPEQTHSTSQEDVRDGEQEKSIFGTSKFSICSVCKSRRPHIGWKKDFTNEELQLATEGFSIKNSLSEEGYGSIFKGQLGCELEIVVKQHHLTDSQVKKQMMLEVQLILKARHKNVAMLLGSSTDESQLLTVYEYACNGSLDKYLSKESCRPLSWGERVKIAVGVSRGLKYLHDNNIIHGSIKPSNILLNHDFQPMLGDFSFGRRKRELKKSHDDKNSGNSRYTAPEYLESGKQSTKIDVYSFGVVLLELITGRRATDKISGGKSLVEWAKPLLGRKKYPQLVDPKVGSSYEEEQLRWLAQVTEQCLRKNPKERLSMNMVVSALQGITDGEQGCAIEDFSPEVTNSTCSVSDISCSQGKNKCDQLAEDEQIRSSHYGEVRDSELKIVDHDMIGLMKVDHLTHGEKSSQQVIINNHLMALTKADRLNENEEHMHSIPYVEQISSKQKISNNPLTCQTDPPNDNKEVQTSVIRNETPVDQMKSETKADIPIGHQGEVVPDSSVSLLCSICKCRRPNIGCQKEFTYNELEAATDGFSIHNSLSEGENGPAFRGTLDGKLKIVVKIHQITSSLEEKIFKSEVQLLTEANHKNVIMLLGSCENKNQQMIVYECACNGSLDQYLPGGIFRPLTWRERVKVAIGFSRGLKYLHEINIIHGNLKPSNILLTHEFNPLLGDFGFGKGKLDLKKSQKEKNVSNSEYTAPEYLLSGKPSTKTDVYSFGMVLLELMTGRRATDKLSGGKSLVQWARPLLGGKKYPLLVDTKISSSYKEDQLQWLLQVTEQCLRKNPRERLSMNMVVSALQDIEDTDDLCPIEDSPPEKSYLPQCVPGMTCSRGQAKDDQLSSEQGQIGSIPYGEEMSLRPKTKNNDIIDHRKTDQLSKNEEQTSSIRMIYPIQADRIVLDQECSFAIANSLKLTPISDQIIGENEDKKQKFIADQKQKLIPDHQKQMQCSFHRDSFDGGEGKIVSEDPKFSVCSICKSKRPNNGWRKDFTYNELQAATEGFSIKNSLSEGVYGPAFIGKLKCDLKVVVKLLQLTSSQEEKMFKSEVKSLTKARHENVVMLLGSCIEETKLLIVYENACNGSLDQYLSGESCRSLTWRERVKIAIGASRGLKYLHENDIIHGNIKPSNIFLTHEFESLVGDFGFGKSKNELKNWHKNKIVGSSGYMAPEFMETGNLSTKTDVYSLGVVLLELITGHRVTDKISGEKSLVEWAKPLLRGRKYQQLVDPKISSSCDDQELLSFVQVIEKCLRTNPMERLTMNMVISALPCMFDDKPVVSDSSGDYGEPPSIGDYFSGDISEGTIIHKSSSASKEIEGLSNMAPQESQGPIVLGGAKIFYLEGAKEYKVDEQFFKICIF